MIDLRPGQLWVTDDDSTEQPIIDLIIEVSKDVFVLLSNEDTMIDSFSIAEAGEWVFYGYHLLEDVP